MEKITLCDYDPCWPAQFAEIAARVRSALGEALVVAVEHVGSTSVPGLAAKPIIDLDVVIPSEADLPQAITGLAALGYAHQGDLGIVGREAFRSPPGASRHHLYVCPADSPELRRHIAFREHLKAHADEVYRYAALKRGLAVRFQADRVAYSDAKSDFVAAILRKAQEMAPSGSPSIGG